MSLVDRTTELPTPTDHAGVSDNAVRGRANAGFFVVMDRYINWIGRHAKGHAFGEMAGPVICEIGPGVGSNFDYYPDGAQVIGIEPNLRMVPHLHRRAGDRGMQVQVHTMGAESLPLEDGSVDEVVCSLVLCTVEDPDTVVSEIRRVLRPGGRFRFVEHVAAPSGSLRSGVQRLLRAPWRWGFEGCCLDRDTATTIGKAGFQSVEIEVGKMPKSVFYPVNHAIWGVATR